ncbi:SDR family oxidoreductase [Sinorhizobium meliloti]|uniref:SDR family oxidoreductase n=1 Tax=Rhizobium meliloti TaxID=382 RepID=UPI003F145119
MVARGFFPYGPSKAALEAASRIWATELAGTGVDVNVFLPGGATATDLLPHSPELRGSEEIFPTSIMRAGILWLSSDESNGVTGRRFVACNWNESLSPSQAAEGAATPAQGKPGIM